MRMWKYGFYGFFIFVSLNLFASKYYWVGNTGNWSDTAHWAVQSGGTQKHLTIPGENDSVYIDANSFTQAYETLIFDVDTTHIAYLMMDNSAYYPQFFGSNQSEIKVSQTAFISDDINNLFSGTFVLLGTTVNNSFRLPPNSPSNIICDASNNNYYFYSLQTSRSLTVKSGNCTFNSLSVENLLSVGNGSKLVDFSNLPLELTGDSLVLDLKADNLNISNYPSIISTTYVGANIVNLQVDTLYTEQFLSTAHKIRVDGYFDIDTVKIPNIESFELVESSYLVSESFSLQGSCDDLKKIKGLGSGAYLDNKGMPFSFFYVEVNNIIEVGSVADIFYYSSDLGSNSNLTFVDGRKFYWINGQGVFSDTLQWSYSPNGSSVSCLPGIKDTVIINSTSGFNSLDTLFFDFNFEINTLILDNNVPLVIAGSSDSIFVNQSLKSNSIPVNFVWNGSVLIGSNESFVSSIQSNGINWEVPIRKKGANTLVFLDEFTTSGNFYMHEGALNSNDQDLTFLDFFLLQESSTSIDFSNSDVLIKGDSCFFISPLLINADFTSSSILLDNPTSNEINFYGGNNTFNRVEFSNGTNKLFGSGTYKDIILYPGNVNFLDSTAIISYENLILNSDCSNRTSVSADIFNPSPKLNFVGPASNSDLEYIDLINIDADTSNSKVYNLYFGDTLNNSKNWNLRANTYYWIGNSPVWTDVNNWSDVSGGLPVGCLPSKKDSVVFDENSFLNGVFDVLVDQEDTVFAFSAKEINVPMNLILINNIHVETDLLLSSMLTFNFSTQEKRILIEPNGTNSNIETNGCNLTVPIVFDGFSLNDTISLRDDLSMESPNSNLVISGGVFKTNGFEIKGTRFSFQSEQPKSVFLDSSYINLSVGIFDTIVSNNLSFSSGSSKIFIDSTVRFSFIRSHNGLSFHDVVLSSWFEDVTIAGDNSFNYLTILPASRVSVESNSTQTIYNTLTMQGTCLDSINLFGSQNGLDASFVFNADSIYATCLNIKDIHSSSFVPAEVYFSSNLGNTNGWSFKADPVADVDFSMSSDICFGDTVEFVNLTTNYFGSSADVILEYNFDDTLGYIQDTSQYVFLNSGNSIVQLRATHLPTSCFQTASDSIFVRDPGLFLDYSTDTNVCDNESVLFNLVINAEPTFVAEFFVNDVSTGSASIDNDSLFMLGLSDLDKVYAVGNDMGCFAYSDTVVFSVDESPNLGYIIDNDTICFGDVVHIEAKNTDEYKFFKNDVPFTFFNVDSIKTLSNISDLDSFYVVGIDTITGCTDTSEVRTITVNPNPVITLSSSDVDNTICFGDQVTFTPSGAIDYDFLTNGVSQTGFVTSPWVTTALTNGQTVSVVGRDANGCVSTAPQSYTHLVNVIPTPTISTNDSDTSICAGDLVQFTSSGAAQYQFFVNGNSFAGPSGTTFTSTSSLTNNDEVYVVGTSNNCSGFSDTIVYEVIDLPNLVFTSSDADNTICQGDVVDFTATGGTTYQFTLNGSIQQTNTTGLYSNANLNNGQVVTVEATQNGCSIDQSITTTVNPKPSVNLFTTESDFTICEGETITFNASNATTYEFFVNGVSQGAPTTQNSFNPSTLPVGSPEVYVVGYNSFDCFDISDTITITVNALPVVGLASSDLDNVICENESVVFTASGAAQYQFFVNGASQGLPNSNNQFTTTNLLNTDTISVLGNTLGCSQLSLTEFVMTVNPNPTVSLSSTDSDNIFCEGDAVTITASGATNYEFFLNTTSTGIASTQNIIDASTLTAGTYVLDVEGEALGCVNTSQLSFTIFGGASVNLVSSDIDNTVCAGETVQFTGSGATLYEFFVNGNTQGSPSTNPNFNATGLVDGDAVSVNASTAQGCSAISNTIVTTVLPTPSVNLLTSATNTSICQGDQVTFTATGATDYTFLVDGVSAFPSGNVATYTTDTLSTGQAISVIGSTGQCSATSTTTFSYTVFDNPVVSLTNPDDNNLCVGEAANLIASGANNYQFSINGIPQGALSALNTFTTSVNDGDQITVTGESNNCTSAAPQTVTYTVIPFPATTLSSSDADNVICLDESVTFTANGASTYTFFVDGIEQVNTTPNTLVTSGIENGNLVAVVGFNGDCQTTAPTSFAFTVNEMDLDVSALPSNYMICEGESFELTATGGDNYEFFVNGVSQGPLSPTSTFTSTNLLPGDFIEFLAANNTTGCIQNYSNTIYPTVVETPVLTANGPTTFCENDSVVLLSNVQGNIEWYLDGGLISNETDTAYIAESTGAYYFDLTSGGNNEVYALGFNANGELGVGNNFNTAFPTQANNITNALVIDAGDEFGGSITVTGELFMWGQNNSGQLGNGTFTSTNNPILITGVPPLSTLSLGSEHAVVVTNTGAVFAWGQNDFGQLGIGNTLTVNTPQLVTAVNNIVEVASGKSHTLFLRNDGTVWSVGNNDFGQLGNGTLVSSSVPAQIGGLTDVASIQVGEYHSIAITTTGNVFVWGNNTVGQLGLGDLTNRLSPTLNQLKDIVDADGGATHTLLLNEDGEVFATGGNAFGQLGTGDQLNRLQPVLVAGLNGVQTVSAGQYHSLALKQDFSVWGYGRNVNEQLGALATTSILNATQLNDAIGVTSVSAGKEFTQFIYGLSNTCSSNTIAVDELPAPVPVITLSNGSLVSSETADSYQWFVNGVDILNSNSLTQVPSQNGNYVVETTYSNGCTQASSPYVFSNLGLDELNVSVQVYPNPVRGLFQVVLSQGQFEEVSVLDVAGRLIYTTQEQTNKLEINAFNWEKGVYIVRVNTKNGQIEKRIIKQ